MTIQLLQKLQLACDITLYIRTANSENCFVFHFIEDRSLGGFSLHQTAFHNGVMIDLSSVF